jgi:hypothetical protein
MEINMFDREEQAPRESEENFHGRESSGVERKNVADSAARVASSFRGASRDRLEGCKIIHQVMEATGKDNVGRNNFLGRLVVEKVITQAQAKVGREDPTISKLCTTGANYAWLACEAMRPVLPQSFSAMYEMVLVRDRLSGSEDEKTENLVTMLRQHEGAITREVLTELKHKLTSEQLDERSINDLELPSVPRPSLVAQKPEYDVVLLTPGARDISKIATDYANESELGERLPALRKLKQKGAGIILVPLRDSAVVVAKLVPLMGQGRPRQFHLVRQPTVSSIGAEPVLIVASRGPLPAETNLFSNEGDGVPALAERLFPDAEAKLHAFSQHTAPGWDCLSSEETWKV